MTEPNPSLWDDIELPLLRRIVEAYDRLGMFRLDKETTAEELGITVEEVRRAAWQLAELDFIESMPGGDYPYSVRAITEKSRQIVSGYPSPRIEASVPQLDDLNAQLGDMLEQVAKALQAQPDHPKASKWRAFLNAGTDVGVELTAKSAGEITKALMAG